MMQVLRRGQQQIVQIARARRALPTTATAPAPAYLEIALELLVVVEEVLVVVPVVLAVPEVVTIAELPEALPSERVR